MATKFKFKIDSSDGIFLASDVYTKSFDALSRSFKIRLTSIAKREPVEDYWEMIFSYKDYIFCVSTHFTYTHRFIIHLTETNICAVLDFSEKHTDRFWNRFSVKLQEIVDLMLVQSVQKL